MIALLANPESGSGEAGEVERLLRAHDDVARFDLDLGDDVVAANPTRIVVAGGDGSVGSGAAIAARAGVPLGVVAVGTANDFARTMNLPRTLFGAVDVAAAGTQTERLDLGRVGDRAFVNAASAGLSPVAARKAHGLKRVLGPFAYTVGALRAGLFAKPVHCSVVIDGEPSFEGDAWQVIVGLTGAFGAGAEVDADPADGRLDVVAIEAGSRARLIARAYGLRTGNVESQRGVFTASGRTVEVRQSGAGAGFNVDGELIAGESLTFRVEPQAFEVVVGP